MRSFRRSIIVAGLLGLCLSQPLAASTYTWDAWVRLINPATSSSMTVSISASTLSGCTTQLNAYLYPPSTQTNPPLVHSHQACTRTWRGLDTVHK